MPDSPALPADLPGTPDLVPDAETLHGRMGIEISQADAECCTATMPVAPNRQPYGLLHGGANAVLAETVASVAAAHHGRSVGRVPVGVDLNCTHHRAVRAGVVTGTATRLHGGRSMVTYGVEITDEQGRLVCTARLTCALIEPRGHAAS